MADPCLVICPECNARHHEDLIRCPGCHAFLIDANPWRSQQSLLSAMGALVITILMIVASQYTTAGITEVVNNPISQTIVLFGAFGILLLISRLRTVTRQQNAFTRIRQITCDNRPVTPVMIEDARLAVAAAGIPAYNQALAFQRLRWLSSAASAPVSERQAVLEACRQHAEADLDAVDQSFSRINFLVWLLPTAGFLGTVFGMTEALQAFAGVVESGSDFSFNAGLTDTARNLGVAFHTTLVGLAAVIPLLALATLVRSRTQTLIDSVNRYFLQLGTHMLYRVAEPALDEAAPTAAPATAVADPAPVDASAAPAGIWPTPPAADGQVPTVITLMSSSDHQQHRQAAYLVQAVGTIAKSGAITPDQFQAVIKTPAGNVTVPAIVKNEDDTQILVFTWAAAWDDTAIAGFESWLSAVQAIGNADQTAPVLLLSAESWPQDRPQPTVLQALQIPLADGGEGSPAEPAAVVPKTPVTPPASEPVVEAEAATAKPPESEPETSTANESPAESSVEPPAPVSDAETTRAVGDADDESAEEIDLTETQRTTAPGPLSPPPGE